jgi:hypothetical protein
VQADIGDKVHERRAACPRDDWGVADMARAIEDVQKGWKVFAGADELGSVKEVGSDEIVVSKGVINRHEYHVPADLVESADEGIVDLAIDRETLERIQS